MLSSLATLLLAASQLLTGTTASPLVSRSSYAVKDSHVVPRQWTNIGPADPDHMLRLTIALTQHRFDELDRHLMEVSDPTHQRYGQHLSKEEVDELVKPSDEALDLVEEWLSNHDIEVSQLEYSSAKDHIKLSVSVAEVERLLETEYSVYEHPDGSRLVRTPEWSLPIHLHQHISTIQPTNAFLRNNARSTRLRYDAGGPAKIDAVRASPSLANATVDAVCNFSAITPTCLRTVYGTLNYTPKAAGRNQMALTDYLGEVNNRSDVTLFLQQFRPEAVAAAGQYTQVSINNGTVAQNNTAALDTGIEGNLDAETMLGIAWPTPLTTYSTGGLNPTYKADNVTTTDSDEPYLAWVNHVLGLKTIPQTISTSYGDDEQTVSKAYAVHVCNQFAQLGARGVTLLFASGDYGVGTSGLCYSNSGGGYQFLPSFPNSCPYVTNVGATTGYPEVAADDTRYAVPFTSGAGFSNYFAMPAYQKKVVNAYVQNLNGVFDGLYNKSGRAYPEIAALGQRYAIVWNGSVTGVDGTSASTPAAAGVITLVNDALIAAGKKPLGFMNPWLYGGGYKAFTDVLQGSSAGCNTTGFPAMEGWDAVTGFGTPYLPNILKALGV